MEKVVEKKSMNSLSYDWKSEIIALLMGIIPWRQVSGNSEGSAARCLPTSVLLPFHK